MLNIKGVEAFKAKLKAVMPTVEAEVNTKFRKLGRLIFTDLVTNSPQWSGNLASNWRIGSGSYSQISGYENWQEYANEPYRMGDDPAVSMTLMREMQKLSAVTYRDEIHISNPTPYASEVEAGEAPNGRPIREENKLAEYGGVAMIGYVTTKYGKLGGKKLV